MGFREQGRERTIDMSKQVYIPRCRTTFVDGKTDILLWNNYHNGEVFANERDAVTACNRWFFNIIDQNGTREIDVDKCHPMRDGKAVITFMSGCVSEIDVIVMLDYKNDEIEFSNTPDMTKEQAEENDVVAAECCGHCKAFKEHRAGSIDGTCGTLKCRTFATDVCRHCNRK